MATKYDIISRKRSRYDVEKEPACQILNRQFETMEARFAMACIERWGMVAAEVDGEDSAGRSKLRRLTVEEIVTHACDTAQCAYEEFETRGWILSLPGYEEIREQAEERAQREADEEEARRGKNGLLSKIKGKE